jgi:hypothetical protein
VSIVPRWRINRSQGKVARWDSYISILLSLELGDSVVSGHGISANLNTEKCQNPAIELCQIQIKEMPTCENADELGPRRAARRHCREGATKARAEIIMKLIASKDQQTSAVYR